MDKTPIADRWQKMAAKLPPDLDPRAVGMLEWMFFIGAASGLCALELEPRDMPDLVLERANSIMTELTRFRLRAGETVQ